MRWRIHSTGGARKALSRLRRSPSEFLGQGLDAALGLDERLGQGAASLPLADEVDEVRQASSSAGAGRGRASTTSSTRVSSGSTGSATAGCSSRSATCRRRSSRPPIIGRRGQGQAWVSTNRVSAKPGAVQLDGGLD
jgi:hypothetical protein